MSSASAQEAVAHLQAQKPLGAWSVETKSGAMRLLRRKISVTDSYFLDIHHDPASGCVVGILSKPKSGGKAQAQVLVDKDGKLVGSSRPQIVSVSSYDPNRTTAAKSASRNATATTTTSTTNSGTGLSDDQNKMLQILSNFVLWTPK